MRIRIIDAFTDRPFSGNPAAVCLLDDADAWPDEAWMQQVAAEMHLSDTAFAHPLSVGGEADWALRWFTPEVETNLCGHATLATAYAMYRDRRAPGTVRFASRSGVLVAHSADDGTITLDFPAAPATEVGAPDGLAEALGATPRATYATGALGDLIALLDDEAAVRSVAPDLGAIARIARRDGIRGTIVTASGADPGGRYDFVSRFFAPADGIPEDPVTGSAHTALAPFWSERLGRDDLTALQASARGGLVRTSIHGDRVHLTGHAVIVVDGTLTASR
jgi:PhzF family phenazine biosynthesis protein